MARLPTYEYIYGKRYSNILTSSLGNASSLPKLSDQQQEKLRLLSLLPLARKQSNLKYNDLQSDLALSSDKELEKLVTKAIYSNLVTGTLDPARQLVNITSVAPLRDLAPGSVPALAASLATWSAQCTSMLATLDADIQNVKLKAKNTGQQKERVQNLVDEKMVAAEKEETSRPKRGAGALENLMNMDEEDGDDVMDLDQNEGGRGLRRNAKRGGFGLGRH
jgi:COP9 signalosome complex subunit 7